MTMRHDLQFSSQETEKAEPDGERKKISIQVVNAAVVYLAGLDRRSSAGEC